MVAAWCSIVKHAAAGERAISEFESGGVAVDDFDRRAFGEAFAQTGRQVVADLYRPQTHGDRAEHVGGGAIAGPDLEDVVADIGLAKCPRQDHLADHLPPLFTAAIPVSLVHIRSPRPRAFARNSPVCRP
jgi:hypothetical protein